MTSIETTQRATSQAPPNTRRLAAVRLAETGPNRFGWRDGVVLTWTGADR